MINIKYVNQKICLVDCEESAAMELSEHLCFEIPNARFSPKYKAGMWDGKIRLFSPRSPYLALGLAPRAASFFKKSGYDINVDSGVIESFLDHTYEQDELDSWIDSCDLRNELGESITPFDHQLESVHCMLKHKRMILVSPTNSGKSLIIFLVALRRLEISDRKVLIIVPNVNLVGQMYRDICAYSDDTRITNSDVQEIYAGKDKKSKCKIVISTWQSIFKEDASWFDDFETVICDEGHLATAQSINSIMDKCHNATYRYAMTGTLTGQKCHQLVIEANFGPVKKFVTTKDLMDAGISAQLDVKSVIFNYDDNIIGSLKKRTYDDELKFVMHLPERNNAIINLVSRLNGNVIVLFNNVEHGDILLDCSNGKQSDKKFFYISGRTSVEERKRVIAIMEKETNVVVFATYGIFSVGISVKNIDHLVFASSTKSIIRVLQSIGRALRVSQRKKMATAWDIVDNLSTNNRINYSIKHYLQRQEIFEREEFPIKVIEVPISR